MTEAEKAYHHALQYWWKRAVEAEKRVSELVDQVAGLEEERLNATSGLAEPDEQ